MKLYDGGSAPNPRRVNLFAAEKGIELTRIPVDMGKMEHQSDMIEKLNPLKRLPILELDDGTVICETVAICRYLEEIHPKTPLMGTDAKDKAIVEMWQRRVELHLFFAVAHAFRHLHPRMATWELPQVTDWGEVNKDKAIEACEYFDGELANRQFIAGDNFTIADITFLVSLDFCKWARIKVPEEFKNLHRLYNELKARPSSVAFPI